MRKFPLSFRRKSFYVYVNNTSSQDRETISISFFSQVFSYSFATKSVRHINGP